MKKNIFSIYLLMLMVFIVSGAAQSSSPIEHHEYLKQTGSESLHFDWQLTRGNDLTLLTTLGTQKDTTRMGLDLSTLSWSVDDPQTETLIKVSRQGQKLAFQGVFNGDEIDRKVKIDSAPWYQALSLSLRQFTDSEKMSIEFWSIRPDTLDVHRLKVFRETEESIKINNVTCETIKLKIQLTGLKAVFWSCYYWLRKDDGLFVRYEGPSGPPGWPLTRVELINPCHQVQVNPGGNGLISKLQE